MELKLLLFPVFEFEDPPALKEEPLLLFDVLLDVDNSALCMNECRLDEDPNLDFACAEFEKELADGLGGGIKALAETCLCYKLWASKSEMKGENVKKLINYFLKNATIQFDTKPDSFHH